LSTVYIMPGLKGKELTLEVLFTTLILEGERLWNNKWSLLVLLFILWEAM
jgi:predicted Abi (CAAX) family protease